MKKTFFLMLVLSSIGTIALAQNSFQVHFGAALPTGRFANNAKKLDIGSGNAAMGINVGAKALFPLRQEGLSFTTGIDIFYNGWKADFKAIVDDELESVKTYSNYINIPLTTGIEYITPISNELDLFGSFGLGVNYLKITPLKGYDDYEDATYLVKFLPSVKVAYQIGAGLEIKDKFILGMNYYGLGSHKIKYGVDYEHVDEFNEVFTRPLAVGILSITFGVKF